MNCLLFIVGPTGIGKSKLAIEIAHRFNGEVVSADSRQIYCGMNIGTAKPGTEELSVVAHHLIDIINPDEEFSLAQYQAAAYKVINEIQQRDKLPILVGGSGQYVWSVLEGWGIPKVAPDMELRNNLEQLAANGQGDKLYEKLMELDPEAAKIIDKRNVRRIIRALEVCKQSSTQFSKLREKKQPDFKPLVIGLTADRADLYRKIDERVNRMIETGLVDEVQSLRDKGYHFGLPAMSGIGYKEIGLFLTGAIEMQTAVQQIKYATHRYVRQQYNWFKLKDGRINWFDVWKGIDSDIFNLVDRFIRDCDEIH